MKTWLAGSIHVFKASMFTIMQQNLSRDVLSRAVSTECTCETDVSLFFEFLIFVVLNSRMAIIKIRQGLDTASQRAKVLKALEQDGIVELENPEGVSCQKLIAVVEQIKDHYKESGIQLIQVNKLESYPSGPDSDNKKKIHLHVTLRINKIHRS